MHLLNVLCVSKAFNAEASAIAYGANRFAFESGYALSVFKSKVGRNFTLLKDITIEDLNTQSAHSLFQDLAALKAPTHIALPDKWYCWSAEVHEVAPNIMADIIPFLMNRVEWDNRAWPRPEFHTVSSIDGRHTQRERLGSLFIFGVQRGLDADVDYSNKIIIGNENHGNVLYKSALLEIWNKFLDENQNKDSFHGHGPLIVYNGDKEKVVARKSKGLWRGTMMPKL